MLDIDAKLAELESRLKALRPEIENIEMDISALRRAKVLLAEKNGRPARTTTQGRSIPDLAEQLLLVHGELHVDKMSELMAESGHNASPAVITAAMSRYIKKGRRFKRTGRGKYALK